MIKQLFALLVGFTITGAICGITARVVTAAFQLNQVWFWVVFIWCAVALIAINQIISSMRLSSQTAAQAALKAEQTKYQILQGVECHACRELHDVPVVISETNTFTCTNCGADNKMLIATKTCAAADQATTFDMDVEIMLGNIGQ